MNNVRDHMFRKVNFDINILTGSDGQNLEKCMSNERKQHSLSFETALFDRKSDVSNERLPKCVQQAGAQLTENTDLTERAL